MKYSSTGAICLVAALSVFAAGSAFSQQNQGDGQHPEMADGSGEGHGEMHRQHHGDDGKRGQGGMRGHGDRGGMSGHGDRGGMREMMVTFDTDGDGNVTQVEIDAVRQGQITEFDSNGDGSLDLTEYQALWLDAMRERMVDRFQAHDDDGDGSVTVEEFNENFSDMVERMDRNGDGVLNADDRGMRR